MSYCRFAPGYCDVYLYPTGYGVDWGATCSNCSLVEGCADFTTPEEAMAHLEEHRKKGDLVPEGVFDRLRGEAEGRYWHGRNEE